MIPQRSTVLIVESSRERRDPIVAWLEADGHEVIMCPGPGAADWTCLGGRGERCALAAVADVVVLDMELASDLAMTGTPGWQLLLYYMALGKRVVALVGESDPVRPMPDGEVAVVRRPVEHADFMRRFREVRIPEG